MARIGGNRLCQFGIVSLILGCVALWAPVVGHSDVATPKIPAAQGGQCVEPVEIMRRDHFDFMQHETEEYAKIN